MTESSLALAANKVPTGQLYKEAYDKMLGNTTQCAKIVNLLSNVILLAVFVTGCVGAASAIPGFVMGWTVVGLGSGYMALKLLGGNTKNRKVDLISSALVAAVLITFGALGCAGVLTNAHVGYALIGSVAVTAFVSSYMMIFAKRREDKQAQF